MFIKKNKIFVIAEAGNNHEGDFKLAKKLILEAKKSGADAIKFQTIIPELLVSNENKKRLKQLNKFKLSFKEFKKLSIYAKERKITFLSTPTDITSANFLNNIQSFFKIASGDNNFLPLIKKIASFNKSIILSTGLADLSLISNSKKIIFNEWKKKSKKKKNLVLMHCVSSYPVEPKDANLLAIKTLRKKYKDCVIGYSDHTIGTLSCITAAALGAKVIEKHFTLNKNQSQFRDHKLSADPKEMRELIKSIRYIEITKGNGIKKLEKGEQGMLNSIRRKAVSSVDLKKGDILTSKNIKWLRAAGGIRIDNINKIYKKRIKKNLKKNTIIKQNFIY
tara:strand:- start:574 stop:1578 length:1005 start_codon:yes stop_codon:yes gene_type:complete